MPGMPMVAAFETEFHRTMPEHARLYGVPRRGARKAWRSTDSTARSHQYIGERAAEMLGRPLRLVSCHLGGSSSMCAIDRGRSVDTTMGFSPQSGLENATRHGDLDVFAVLYMMERHGWSAEEVRATTGAGRRAGRAVGRAGRRRARHRSRRARKPAATGAGGVRLPGEEDHRRIRGGDGRAGSGGLHRRNRRELGARSRAACCAGLEFLGIATRSRAQ